MFLRDYIDQLNTDLGKIIGGTKVYGLAQPIVRTVGSEQELLPGVVNRKGEIEYVGVDGDLPVIIYHKNSGVQVRVSAQKGVGDNQNDLINSYQMAMVVFINVQRVRLYPEEYFLYLQANMPTELKIQPYKQLLIRMTNVILNSQLVFQAEYGGTQFTLPPSMSLFQINYTIESTFSKSCFAKCPDNC